MWLGLLMGFLIGILIISFVEMISNNIGIISIILILIILTVSGGLIGIYFNKINYDIYINSYIAKKEVIEQSLNNEILSDLEKIELVKQVIELNGELAENKVKYNKFICFYLDRNKINNIEMINLENKE